MIGSYGELGVFNGDRVRGVWGSYGVRCVWGSCGELGVFGVPMVSWVCLGFLW